MVHSDHMDLAGIGEAKPAASEFGFKRFEFILVLSSFLSNVMSNRLFPNGVETLSSLNWPISV